MIVARLEALFPDLDPLLCARVQKHMGSGMDLAAHRLAADASPLARALLGGRGPDGKIPLHPYQKWGGAHWVLACLAELEYPPGDPSLLPLFEQVYGWLLSPDHIRKVPVIEGRARRCGSQEGYALLATCRLGLADERAARLAENLCAWQWPDGGWNCDTRPQASHASFHESWLPLRALTAWARLSGDPAAERAAERAAELFLSRRLLWHQTNGSLIDPDFARLFYPAYWHYGLLPALKTMQEVGRLDDPRCTPALDLLRSKQLLDGGFPLEGRYFKITETPGTSVSRADYGRVDRRKANPFVTLEAWIIES